MKRKMIARIAGGALTLGTLYWSSHTWMDALFYWLIVAVNHGSKLGVFLGVASVLVLGVAHTLIYLAVELVIARIEYGRRIR